MFVKLFLFVIFSCFFSLRVLAGEINIQELKDLATEYSYEMGRYYFGVDGEKLILHRQPKKCELNELGLPVSCELLGAENMKVHLDKIIEDETTIMSHLSANKTQPQKLSIGRYALVSDQGLDLNIHILKVVNVSTKDIQYHMILKIEASNGTFEQSVRLFPINQVWQTF